MPENKNPYHFEKKDTGTAVQAYNPMCGDKYTLYLDSDQAHFHGIGCAISKASTSLLLKNIEGMTDDQQMDYCRSFLEAIKNDGPFDDFAEPLQVLGELKKHEGRVDCIELSWKALLNHLKTNEG